MATNSYHGPVVAVQDLVKRYPKVPFNAVENVSFTIEPGEILGLLGPNGAGKTTIVSILTTRMLPTDGNVRIMGIDITKNPMKTKKYIAVVPQQSNLDQSLRAREILTFHAAYHGIKRKEREERADKLLNDLGLADRRNDKIGYYSGGMGQRIMIARALMHNPNVIFLDEPTNRLDPQSRLFLWERILTLKKQGLAILLTTHDMNEADQLCDRIAIMDHGHILKIGTPAELKKMIPGATRLELRIRTPENAFMTNTLADPFSEQASLENILTNLPGVTKVEEVKTQQDQQNIHTYRLYAQNTREVFLEAAQLLEAQGIDLLDFTLTQASLEDVFIHLTGRNLRA
jgi:ABC-2 type transport system ATP-binding protein